MNSKERFYAMLEGKTVDRIPNLNILMLFAAKHLDIPYSAFCQDYRELIKANIACNEEFSIDLHSTLSDPYRETYDFGTPLEFPEDDLPKCLKHRLNDIEEVDDLELFDPYKSTRMLDRINAIKLYKETCKDKYPILGWVEGPLAEACDLRGINEAMVDIMVEEELFAKLMEKCVQEAVLCAKAQVDAGADVIGIGDAAASIIGLPLYESMVFPYEKMLINEIKAMGAKIKLHICGNIDPLLLKIKELEVDILDIDYMVDMEKAVNILDGVTKINGNINPVDILNGTPKSIEALVKEAVAKSKGKAFISGGCEIPKFTPVENLLAFANALK